MTPTSDLVVVGAGIVGLAHAVEALARGLSVTVVERDERPVGASVRNFGHGCITAQTGEALAFAERGRGTWLRMGRAAGFRTDECGTVVVARADEEMAALEELAADRGDDVVLLDPAGVAKRVPVHRAGLVGGAFLPATCGVRAGHAAGAGMVVAVLSGAQTRDELAAERPTHVLAGVRDIPALLRRPAAASPR